MLNRPKFAMKVDPLSTVELFDSVLKESAELFSLRENVADCLNPKDNKLFDCALVAGASVIVSSDRHLRRVDPYQGIRSLNPQEFLLL